MLENECNSKQRKSWLNKTEVLKNISWYEIGYVESQMIYDVSPDNARAKETTDVMVGLKRSSWNWIFERENNVRSLSLSSSHFLIHPVFW